ncbi:MAG TPA: ATPase [Flavobacteriales bacterium]|nr:ATPase [Flavobacteriales bacterium]
MTFNDFREIGNVYLYKSKSRNLGILKLLNLIVSLTALVVLAIYYGYPNTAQSDQNLMDIMRLSFGFYVVHYLIKILYDFHPAEFLRRTWIEGIVMIVLIIEGVSHLFFDTLIHEPVFRALNISSGVDLSLVFIQIYFFIVVIAELLRKGSILPRVKMHPAIIFILSFLGIITVGTLLLMMPEMTTSGNGMPTLDALFTSTSATCVTGLMVEDTMVFFTFKGQMVLLALIQLGGLNVIAFASFLALVARFGVAITQHDVIEDFVNRDSYLSGKSMLGRVVLWCLGIEMLGAIALGLVWSSDIPFNGLGDRIFSSIFHSVSAFNNAGITLFTDGMAHPWVATNWLAHWVITILVFFGALGMIALFDLFDPAKLRSRMRSPWKTIGFATKIALYFSFILVFIGAISFAFLEWNGVLEGMSGFGKFTTAIFQSVTRTSGFNSVDIGSVGLPMIFIFIVLMFIGASSSSTGGGIKTSTFAVIVSDVWRTVRGFDHVQLFKRTINPTLRSRAYSVLMFFILGNMVFLFLLTITEARLLSMGEFSFVDLAFEQVSAMGTVGLSTGLTHLLSPAGKMIISLSMFIGRVGTLTVAFALGGRALETHFKYPEGHTMIG